MDKGYNYHHTKERRPATLCELQDHFHDTLHKHSAIEHHFIPDHGTVRRVHQKSKRALEPTEVTVQQNLSLRLIAEKYRERHKK